MRNIFPKLGSYLCMGAYFDFDACEKYFSQTGLLFKALVINIFPKLGSHLSMGAYFDFSACDKYFSQTGLLFKHGRLFESCALNR